VIKPDFAAGGFVVNYDKSVTVPTTRVKYLGMFIDTVRACFEVPTDKRETIVSLIQQVLHNHKHCSVFQLEKLAGNLAAMHWAFGNLARLMSMSLYAEIAKAPHRKSYVHICEVTVQDLNFWLVGFDRYNGFQPIWQPVGFHMTLCTDAAGVNLKNYGGWAGWTKDNGAIKVARGIWTDEQHREWGEHGADHSTYQELFAIFNVVRSFNKDAALAGKRVLVKTDNQAVFSIINRAGSRKPYVHALCKQLIWYCIHEHIFLHANWIPREANQLADFYSKLSDSGDWMLRSDVFLGLSDKFGPFDIDLFSSLENKQVSNFYSLYHQPTCIGVDAFNFRWGRHCWCNPPFFQMARVLDHAAKSAARMCLICPFTPTAPWWPALLCERNPSFFAPFVVECVELGRSSDLFLSGKQSYKFQNRQPRWHSLALLVDWACHMHHADHVQVPSLPNTV
jgi:hypothetical protein